MPAVNRERKHNSNPMGKRKHWYVPCIAPALAALLLTHTPLPLHLVRPMACLAAAAGAALSGALLAGKIGRQRLICGLVCGAFYSLCLLAAAVLAHGVPSWTHSDTMLPLALLLGGTLGGALSAVKEGR